MRDAYHEELDKSQWGLHEVAQFTNYHGSLWATWDPKAPSFEDYLGPEVLPFFDRVFHGRELKLLGYSRQRIPANWKLMQENIKDPYHPGLLHTWFVTFGLSFLLYLLLHRRARA